MSALTKAPHSYARKSSERRIALQWDGTDAGWQHVRQFAGQHAKRNEHGHCWIETPSGPNTITAGDYVGFAGPGDFYVIGSENFERLFDVASAEPVR